MINPFCDVSSLMYMFKAWDESKAKVKEADRLKALVKKAFDLSVCDLSDDEQKQLWEQFKKENKL